MLAVVATGTFCALKKYQHFFETFPDDSTEEEWLTNLAAGGALGNFAQYVVMTRLPGALALVAGTGGTQPPNDYAENLAHVDEGTAVDRAEGYDRLHPLGKIKSTRSECAKPPPGCLSASRSYGRVTGLDGAAPRGE